MSDFLLKCEVCFGLLDEEDLFCSNCGTAAPHRDGATATLARTSTHNFACAGCGASMSYDASAGSLRCPFCGSQRLEQKGDVKVLAASRVVPFKTERDAAVERMRSWLKGGFWRPTDLPQQALVVAMTPVYVPYWVFEATTHTYWTADSSQKPPSARGDWYPLAGEHHGRYAGVLVGASAALSPRETEELCPYDLADALPPDQIDLDNVTVEQFSVPRKYARRQARLGLEAMEVEACRRSYVPGRSRNVKVNMRVEGLASEPVLLPVWMMAYRYRDEAFRFLVNGQTGKCCGKAPVTYKKLGLLIGAVVLFLLLCFCLLGAIIR